MISDLRGSTYDAVRHRPPAPPRPAPVRELLMAALFRAAVRELPIRVALPGGKVLGAGDRNSPVMRIVRPAALYRRLGVCGPIGFGEAYLAGDWSSTDPAAVLTPFAARLRRPASRTAALARRKLDQGRPAGERNTPEGAKANIRRHYELSNDMFALFLDESMTYSSAVFAAGDDLRAAQLRKIDAVLDDAGVRPGSTLIEIGTGWGALAIRAAQRGAEVTTVTNSQEQADLASRRIADAGLRDRVTVQLGDYREASGMYDAVVSVEMIEAVGAEFWPVYFATLSRLAAPGGRVALQAITMPHDRLLATRDVYTWTQKYVFPGGQALSVRAIEEQVAKAGLRIDARRSIGEHYARTLHEWRDRFLAAREQCAALGFDEAFERMWEFYLAYSEAGFRSGFLDCWQIRLGKPA